MFLLIDVGNCRELCTQSASSISSLQCGGTLLFRYSRHGKLSETLVQSVLATLCLPRRGKLSGTLYMRVHHRYNVRIPACFWLLFPPWKVTGCICLLSWYIWPSLEVTKRSSILVVVPPDVKSLPRGSSDRGNVAPLTIAWTDCLEKQNEMTKLLQILYVCCEFDRLIWIFEFVVCDQVPEVSLFFFHVSCVFFSAQARRRAESNSKKGRFGGLWAELVRWVKSAQSNRQPSGVVDKRRQPTHTSRWLNF